MAAAENFTPARSAEEHADQVHREVDKFFQTEGVAEDLRQQIADEHDMMEKRYSALDRRLKAIERQGLFGGAGSEEKMLYTLGLAYLVCAFVIPALIDVVKMFTAEVDKGKTA